MRFAALFPLVCSAIALILAFLAIFAGSQHDQMEQYDLLTLNTSRIGLSFFNTTKHPSTSRPSNDSSFLGSFLDDAKDELKNATDSIEAEIQEDLNKAFRSLAKDLGIYDFYSVHVLDHCEGYFSPNGTSNRNVTSCSNSTGFSNFSPTKTLQKQLDKTQLNVTLADLHFPEAIEDGVQALKLAFNITFVIYVMAIIFTGLAVLGTLVGIFTQGRMSAMLNVGLSGLSFLATMIASAIITYATTKIVNLINREGKVVNINAARGDKFIALTWAATALCLLATASWLIELIAGRRKEKLTPKQYQ